MGSAAPLARGTEAWGPRRSSTPGSGEGQTAHWACWGGGLLRLGLGANVAGFGWRSPAST
eukprot:2054239-Alexandrium_andersonii.AAC.1